MCDRCRRAVEGILTGIGLEPLSVELGVARVAGELAIVPYRLCRSLEMEHTMEGLRLRVTHLVLDLRMDITQKHIKDVKRRLLEAGSDMAKVEPLMREYKEAQQLRNILARRVGNDIVS